VSLRKVKTVIRVALHEHRGNETGWTAWCLDVLGFATWAPDRRGVLARIQAKLDEYHRWLTRHGMRAPGVDGAVSVVEHVCGDEVMFQHDTGPCTVGELDSAVLLLSASREDLLAMVSSMQKAALDWDPPYRSFAEWATWRTVREILAHIANTETHYYLPTIGYKPEFEPAASDGDWEEFLPRHRQETVRFLMELREAADRARVTRDKEEWSVRKVLRRLVWHELLHWKSISRIGREYEKRYA
jgi:hypothetical protein